VPQYEKCLRNGLGVVGLFLHRVYDCFVFSYQVKRLKRLKLENVGGSSTFVEMNNYQRGFSHDLPTLQTT